MYHGKNGMGKTTLLETIVGHIVYLLEKLNLNITI